MHVRQRRRLKLRVNRVRFILLCAVRGNENGCCAVQGSRIARFAAVHVGEAGAMRLTPWNMSSGDRAKCGEAAEPRQRSRGEVLKGLYRSACGDSVHWFSGDCTVLIGRALPGGVQRWRILFG
jgi:hypothetical protein